MARISLGLCIALLIFVQPLLCCCLAAELGSAGAAAPTRPQAATAPNCCCCERPEAAPFSHEQAPLRPAKQECPCAADKPVAQVTANESSSSMLLRPELWAAPTLLPPDVAVAVQPG